MCGRTFCTIDPVCLQKRAAYENSAGLNEIPDWIESPTGESFRPSANMAPTTFMPVLLANYNAADGEKTSERVIQPMRWGLIPSWHKGERSAFKVMHNNCRSETINEKNTFSRPLSKGNRCAVITQGFYEWKSDPSSKKAKKAPKLFFIDPKAESNVKVSSESDIKSETKPDVKVRTEPYIPVNDDTPLMYMACVYDVFRAENGPLYSFSILTTDASSAVSDVHHRMPVILENDEELRQWIDPKNYPLNKVKSLITQQKSCLTYYPVTDKMNNTRYQEPDCTIPITIKEEKPPTTKKTIKDFFAPKPQQKRKSEERTPKSETDDKKIKREAV